MSSSSIVRPSEAPSTTAAVKARRGIRLTIIGILAAVLGLGAAPLGLASQAFAVVPSGTVSGTVTDGANNQLAGIVVYALYPPTGTNDDNNGVVGTLVHTDNNGHYSLTLPVGTYDIQFNDSGNDPKFIDNEADNIVVSDGTDTPVDDTLVTGGVISGLVKDANGDPLSGIVVTSDSENAGVTRTDLHGIYTLTGLSYGPHTIFVNTENRNHDIGDATDTNPYVVNASYAPASFDLPLVGTDASIEAVDDVTLGIPSTLHGVVLGSNGKPLGGVGIYAETVDSAGVAHQVASNISGTQDADEAVETTSNGVFTLGNLPTGKIYLEFVPEDSPAAPAYEPQFLGGSEELGTSVPVVVPAAGSSLVRQVTLNASGRIAGKVTRKTTGKALKGLDIVALPLVAGSKTDIDYSRAFDQGIGSFAVTNSSGSYSITGLPAGSYKLIFNQDLFSSPVATSDTVSVPVYVPVNGSVTQNEALTSPTTVSGIVNGGSPLAPVSGQVEAFPYNPTTHTVGADTVSEPRALVHTANNGSYSLFLDPGTYVIEVTLPNASDFATTYLGGGTSPSDPLTTKLVVGSTALKSKNITLVTAPGTVSADIVDSNGHNSSTYSGLLNIDATLSRVNSDFSVTETVGTYSSLDFPLTNIPDGNYQLELSQHPFDSQYTFAPTYVTFTLSGGVLTEENGDPASGNSLGTITLNAPVVSPYPTFAVNGTLPSLSITTALEPGDFIGANNGDWTPTPSQFFYQWYRDGVPIHNATSQDYQVTGGDVGHAISLGLFVYDPTDINSVDYGSSPDYVTPQTDVVGAAVIAPPATTPTISGIPQVGKTLSISVPQDWTNTGLNISYRWTRTVSGGSDTIVGTGVTYKAVAADAAANTTIYATVIARQAGYATAYADTGQVTVEPATALKLTHAAKITHTVATNSYAVTSPGSWSPSATSFDYSWQVHDPADNSVITADDTGTNTLANAPVGDSISVLITAHRAGYLDHLVQVVVQQGATVNSAGTANIQGTATLGYVLTADLSGIATTPSDASLALQWYRGASKISGATGDSYQLGTSDVGKQVSVRVTPSDPGYPTGVGVNSSPVTVTGGGAFITSTAGISGTQNVGKTLTAQPAVWSPVPSAFSYQWFRISPANVVSKIKGATHSTYQLTIADLGDTVQVAITGTRAGYTKTTVTGGPTDTISAAAQITNLTAPSIGAIAQVGGAIHATAGTWDTAGTTETYQWYVNDVPVVGATTASYIPSVWDLGNTVTVGVVAHRAGYPDSDQASPTYTLVVEQGLAAIASKAPALTVAGKSVTSLKLGTTVTGTVGTWTAPGLTFSYQWQVLVGTTWTDLTETDATSNSLLLDAVHYPGDFVVGHSFRLEITAERAGFLPAAPLYSKVLIAKS